MSLSILVALRLLHLKAENKNKSNPNLLYSSGVQLRCLLMRKNKSFGGQQWKRIKFSNKNLIGLALKMDVVKARCAILINLSQWQRAAILEAPCGATKKPFFFF